MTPSPAEPPVALLLPLLAEVAWLAPDMLDCRRPETLGPLALVLLALLGGRLFGDDGDEGEP